MTSPAANLPPIPEKLYFTIGEVGKLCDLQPHVLRYWEQEFPQLTPSKRRNRRYYQRKDVVLVRRIKDLLYAQGYTIDGARKQLSAPEEADVITNHRGMSIKKAIDGLQGVLDDLK